MPGHLVVERLSRDLELLDNCRNVTLMGLQRFANGNSFEPADTIRQPVVILLNGHRRRKLKDARQRKIPQFPSISWPVVVDEPPPDALGHGKSVASRLCKSLVEEIGK